jgi:hypothetical protein
MHAFQFFGGAKSRYLSCGPGPVSFHRAEQVITSPAPASPAITQQRPAAQDKALCCEVACPCGQLAPGFFAPAFPTYIAIEDADGVLAKSVLNAAWNQLLQHIWYKAESAGTS